MQLGSLEGLSEQEILQLASTARAMFGTPETRREAQRIMKKINPRASIPELDAADEIDALKKELAAEAAKQAQEVATEREAHRRLDRLRALRDDGLLEPDQVKINPETKLAPVEQFMVDNSIQDYTAAAKLYKNSLAAAEPTARAQPTFGGAPQIPKIDYAGSGAKNISQWARDEGLRAIADLQSGKVKAQPF